MSGFRRARSSWFTITNHALDRFRERVDPEHAQLSQDRLREIIDQQLQDNCLDDRSVVDRNDGEMTNLRLMRNRSGAEYVAVIRNRVVITVLERWMAASMYPKWRA